MAKLHEIKTYFITLTVTAAPAREERDLYALTEFVLAAPGDSPLRQVLTDAEHRTGVFPRLLVEGSGRVPRHYTLTFYVEMHQDTDKLVAELTAIFQKNGWDVG